VRWKLSSTVLKTSQSGDRLSEFNYPSCPPLGWASSWRKARRIECSSLPALLLDGLLHKDCKGTALCRSP